MRGIDPKTHDSQRRGFNSSCAEVAHVPAPSWSVLLLRTVHGAAAVNLALHVGNVQRCRFADPQQRIRHDLNDCSIAEAGE